MAALHLSITEAMEKSFVLLLLVLLTLLCTLTVSSTIPDSMLDPLQLTTPSSSAPHSLDLLTSLTDSRNKSVSTTSKKISARQCSPTFDTNNQPIYNCDGNLPTIEEILGNLRNPGIITDPKYLPSYYTGWNNEQNKEVGFWIQKWFEAHLESRWWYWFWTMVPAKWYNTQIAWIQSNMGAGKIFVSGSDITLWRCLSEGMAKLAANPDVYLFTPSDYVIGSEPTRIWTIVEFPQLTLNPAVQRIWRVDPRPPAEGGQPCQKTLIWERGAGGQTVQPKWQCTDWAKSAT